MDRPFQCIQCALPTIAAIMRQLSDMRRFFVQIHSPGMIGPGTIGKMNGHPISLLHAPATARNRGPILEILLRVLPSAGTVLEIASGTGEHAAFFAQRMPSLAWQPSESESENLTTIAMRVAEAGLVNFLSPVRLDVRDPRWPVARADAVFCANMIHIAPWSATEGLMVGAARVLTGGGPMCLYGPFRIGGRHTAPSNEAFDAWLQGRDRDWGVRDLEAVHDIAGLHGLRLIETCQMPANNLTLVFEKAV